MEVPGPVLPGDDLGAADPAEGLAVPPAGALEGGEGLVGGFPEGQDVVSVGDGEGDEAGVALVEAEVLGQEQELLHLVGQLGLAGPPAGRAPGVLAAVDPDGPPEPFLPVPIPPEDPQHVLAGPDLPAGFQPVDLGEEEAFLDGLAGLHDLVEAVGVGADLVPNPLGGLFQRQRPGRIVGAADEALEDPPGPPPEGEQP